MSGERGPEVAAGEPEQPALIPHEFGPFFALVDPRAEIVRDNVGPTIVTKPGPHFFTNSRAAGHRVVRVKVVIEEVL